MSEAKKNFMLGGAAIAIIAVAVVLYFARSDTGASLPTQYNYWGVCLETGQEVDGAAPAGSIPPFENPKTGHATVFPYWICHECLWRFVPQPVKNAEGTVSSPPMARCPHCNSPNTGVWFPPGEMEQYKGTAPLPKMP